MGEYIIDGAGNQYPMRVTENNEAVVTGSMYVLGSVIIGSVSANVDQMYQTSGNTYQVSGNNYQVSGNNYQVSGNVYHNSGNSYIVSGNNMLGSFAITTDPVPISGNTQIFDGAKGPGELDGATFAFTTIEYEHHKIHKGDHYFICGFEILNSGVSANFVTTSPDTTEWAHMKFTIYGTSQTEMRVYEGATISGGTATTPINNNRNSANTSSLAVVQNPTITASGTPIYAQSRGLAGVTPAAASSFGQVNTRDEIILKSGTSYLWAIKSVDDDNIVSFCGEWYEHVNKS